MELEDEWARLEKRERMSRGIESKLRSGWSRFQSSDESDYWRSERSRVLVRELPIVDLEEGKRCSELELVEVDSSMMHPWKS